MSQGYFEFLLWQRSTSYLRGGRIFAESYDATAGVTTIHFALDVDMPNVALTSVTITGLTASASVTLGIRDVVAYRILTS